MALQNVIKYKQKNIIDHNYAAYSIRSWAPGAFTSHVTNCCHLEWQKAKKDASQVALISCVN